MTTQQPAVLDEYTRKMNAWFESSIDSHMKRHIKDINKSLDEIRKTFEECAESFDVVFGQIGKIAKSLDSGKKDAKGKIILGKFDDQTRTIFELLLIIKNLASNDYSRGAVDQIIKRFKFKYDITDKMIISIIDQRFKGRASSRVTKSALDDDQDQSLDLMGY